MLGITASGKIDQKIASQTDAIAAVGINHLQHFEVDAVTLMASFLVRRIDSGTYQIVILFKLDFMTRIVITGINCLTDSAEQNSSCLSKINDHQLEFRDALMPVLVKVIENGHRVELFKISIHDDNNNIINTKQLRIDFELHKYGNAPELATITLKNEYLDS